MQKDLTLVFLCFWLAFSCSKTSSPDPATTTTTPTTGITQGSANTATVFSSHTYSTVFIKKDGSLWTFGAAEFTGREPSVTTLTPKRVGTDNDWSSVSTAWATFAVKSDGTLWSWGQKELIGRTGNNLIPAKVNEDKDWASVYAAPNRFTLALKKDGTLWGCGKEGFSDGSSYFLDGTTTDRPLMTRAGTESDWQKISIYGAEIFLIKKDGSVWGWGHPNDALFGTLDTKSKLVNVLPGNDWVDVAIRSLGGVGLKKDGSLWRWGSTINPKQPQRIGSSNDWVKIITKNGLNDQIYGLKQDGSLWVSGGGFDSPTSFNPVETYNSGDTFESIYFNGNGIVAKRPGKDDYCAFGFSGGSDYTSKYGGDNFLDAKGELKCTSF
ncbi:RCC1 domain-containing protein [Spirosoma flavum]|uniref:RCC1 domain-containing protein n=1 Tax=Spirosoma flavum TaxID=2048557 RepID=A0ABW6AQA2_9BACT